MRAVIWIVLGILSIPPDAGAEGDYTQKIKPLLQKRCYACHGALKQKGELRLDTVALMRKGGDSGAALIPGDAARSLIVERVTTTDETEAMPPKHEGERFDAEEVALLRNWIAGGAKAPSDEKPERDPREHWAFRPPTRPPVPTVRDAAWVRNPVDAFIEARRDAAGLHAAPEAPREVLVRRLHFDLVGVPPNAAEMRRWMEDPKADWYERLVEHLLGDPRHGERWGRHWMDIWRYSDGWGLGAQHRNSQKHMWHFRDWLVESLNADTPYDTMVRLMLAADEIAPSDISALRATGFLARNWFLFNRNSWMEETVEHVGKGLLGLTMNCTKCHDHKYDPFAQTDFYRMRAVFEPYHVRMDILPGEVDVEKDGIPRVFDGRQDVPTYRFERGEESQPDKSRPIEPGAPLFFGKDAVTIQPVPMPPEATEPERQPWVLDAYLTAALSAFEKAQSALSREEKTLEKARAAEQTAPGEKQRADREEAEFALELTRLALQVAECELESVRRRADAIRTAWNPANPEALAAARKAVPPAERNLSLAQAAHTVALKQTALRKAAPDKKAVAAKELKTAEAALQKAEAAPATEPDARAAIRPLPGAKWVPTRFLSSGKDDPEVSFPKTSSGRRKAFAQWVTDPQNPLPARVVANHLWGRHFGFYIAGTPFDLGRSGSPPTHPELLDWLAAELVEHGWSLKHIHRVLVTSATYRMSSSTRGLETELSKDPDNTRIWRRLPVRLEAEAIRDALLTLSGDIDWTRGGPPIPAPAQANAKRRSLYFYHSNNERNLFLTTFDGPMVKECYRREQSIVPQQALALINSALSAEASQKIAALLTPSTAKPGTQSPSEFVHAAFWHVLGMQPTLAETEASLRALAEWKNTAPGTDPEAAARAQLVWVLLNHNDFITLR